MKHLKITQRFLFFSYFYPYTIFSVEGAWDYYSYNLSITVFWIVIGFEHIRKNTNTNIQKGSFSKEIHWNLNN